VKLRTVLSDGLAYCKLQIDSGFGNARNPALAKVIGRSISTKAAVVAAAEGVTCTVNRSVWSHWINSLAGDVHSGMDIQDAT
jgi:hypothetical protein